MSCKKISQDESDVSLYELNNTLTLFNQDGEIGGCQVYTHLRLPSQYSIVGQASCPSMVPIYHQQRDWVTERDATNYKHYWLSFYSMMQVESFADLSQDELYKNFIIYLSKYTSHDHEIFCAYRLHVGSKHTTCLFKYSRKFLRY